MARAGSAEAGFVGFHVIVPQFALLHIGHAEFPIFIALIDACKKAFALLFLGQMEKKLNDPSAVAMQVRLEIAYRSIAILPNIFLVLHSVGNALTCLLYTSPSPRDS